MGYTLALLSMIFAGIGSVLFKESVQRIGANATTLFYYLIGLLFAALLFLGSRETLALEKNNFIWVFAAALSLCLSVLCFNHSLRFINVSVASTIYSLAFLIAIAGGVLFHRETLSGYDYLASMLALAAVLVYGLKRSTMTS